MNKRTNQRLNQKPQLTFSSTVKKNLNHSVEKKPKDKRDSSMSKENGKQRKRFKSPEEVQQPKRKMIEHDIVERKKKNNNLPNIDEEPIIIPEHVKVERRKKENGGSNGREDDNTTSQVERYPTMPEVEKETPNSSVNESEEPNEEENDIILETTVGGLGKKPFRPTGLLNKSHLKLASYIKDNKDVKLAGTKRFADKSGEYYLKNIQLQNSKKNEPKFDRRLSLTNPTNLENCLKANVNKLKHRASKIITVLPENSLTPIPMKMEDSSKEGVAGTYKNKELKDAERTAVFIRRMEYATSMKRQRRKDKDFQDKMRKITTIQEWWKAMNKIIKLQKHMRGFLFRKKLMETLEHQEKLLQFITEFDNIYNFHLYKKFFDNLKKKAEYERAKEIEKLEDFAEKLDNLEKLRNLKSFKDCFDKWKRIAGQKKFKTDIEPSPEQRKVNNNPVNGQFDKVNEIVRDKEKFNIKGPKEGMKGPRINKEKVNDQLQKVQEVLREKNKFNLAGPQNSLKLPKINKEKINEQLQKVQEIIREKNKFNLAGPQNSLKLPRINKEKINDQLQKVQEIIREKNKFNLAGPDGPKRAKKFKPITQVYPPELDENGKHQRRFKQDPDEEDEENNNNENERNSPKKKNELNSSNKNNSPNKSDKLNKSKVPNKNNSPNKSDKKSKSKAPNKKNSPNKSDKLNKSKAPNKKNSTNKSDKLNKSKAPNKKNSPNKSDKLNKSKAPNKNNAPNTKNKDNKDKDKDKKNEQNDDDNFKTISDQLKDLDEALREKEKLNPNTIPSEKLEKIKGMKLPMEGDEDYNPDENDQNTLTIPKQLKKVDEVIRDKEKFKINSDPSNKMPYINELKNINLFDKNDPNRLRRKRPKSEEKNPIKKQKGDVDNKKQRGDRDKNAYDPKEKSPKKSSKNNKDLNKYPKNKFKTGPEEKEQNGNDKKRKKPNDLKENKDKPDSPDKLNNQKLNRLNKNKYNKPNIPDSEEENENNKPNRDKFESEPEEEEEPKKTIPVQMKDIDEFLREKQKFILDPEHEEKLPRINKNTIPKQLDNANKELENRKLLKDAFDKWKNIKDKEAIRDKLLNDKRKEILDNIDEGAERLGDLLNNLLKKDVFDKLKEKDQRVNKRISYRKKPKKDKLKEKKKVANKFCKLLKKYEKKTNLPNKKDLVDNLKKKPDIANKFCKLLKKYSDKTILPPKKDLVNNMANNPNSKFCRLLKKYAKKTILPLKKDLIKNMKRKKDRKSRPPLVLPAKNNYPNRKNNIDDRKIKDNRNDKKDRNNKNIRDYKPYNKNLNKKLNAIPQERKNYINGNDNAYINPEKSETTSVNESESSKITLIEIFKEVKKPRDYVSQSFFINKNQDKNGPDEYKYSRKQIPMKLKGDFASLIEKNPNILKEKNPRIQVLNSTCRLDQIIDDEDIEMRPEEINYEINKLRQKPHIYNNPKNNKILNRVVQNCDDDIYSKKDIDPEDKWYSTSVSLNDKKIRLEFLKDIRFERDQDNANNKFELIQKYSTLTGIPLEKNEKKYETATAGSDMGLNSNNMRKSYGSFPFKLQEMNSQFYRSPQRTSMSSWNNGKIINMRPTYNRNTTGYRGKIPNYRYRTYEDENAIGENEPYDYL